MSHEIRNPITSILGMTNLMFDTNVSSEQSEFLNNIKTSSEILLSLVNDILDLNKIDKEKITLNPIVFDPISLVRSHARNISLNLHNQKVKVRTYFDNDIPKRLLGDVTIINQILLNILGNASKFTHYGTISIQVKLLSRDHKLIWLKFQIDDTGIGISKDELEQIFERFNQAGKATNEKYGGTGLGLHITKKLTEFLGGRIYVESTLNIGSSFTVEIPFQVTDFNVNYIDQPRKTEDYKNKLSAQILIVEDNEINRKYLEKLLLKWNFPFQSAKNGLEALSKLETHQFDLVLMDIRMPIMDGYETSIKLRKMKGNCNQNIPIIALTASALADEKKRALAAGMNHHVTKPYRQEELLGAIQKYLLLEKPNMIEKNHFQFTSSINQTELSELYDNDLIQVVEMFDLFIKNMPHELSLLHKLLEKGNSQEIKDQLHKIKPNFTYTGFNNISTQIKQLEQQVLSTSIDELGTEMSSTLKMMEESLRIVKVEYKRLSQFLQKK
jgi:CheY-like chemotaxis protein/HPt (histidine-containing phosphotransfer) domain-containing protein